MLCLPLLWIVLLVIHYEQENKIKNNSLKTVFQLSENTCLLNELVNVTQTMDYELIFSTEISSFSFL